MSRTSSRTYQRNRARLRRQEDVCWVCGQPIDMELVWPHPGAWTADHITQITDGGHNHGPLAAAHWRCNLARRYQKPQPPRHARKW